MLGKLFTGLSGIQLPIAKYQYPAEFQKTSRLTYYASLFNSIEVNSSFYKIPQAKTVRRWLTEVPEDFAFTFKLFKGITHCRDFAFNETDISEFMSNISDASVRKGCILVQFPPSLTSSSAEQLALLLHHLQAHNHDQHYSIAVEFRNKSWYIPTVFELLDAFGVTLVMHDIPKSATPFVQMQSKTSYLRFHGPSGNYKGSYTDSLLAEYASYVNQWRRDGKTVFVYFNNTNGGGAYDNLVTFNRLVQTS